MIDTKVAKRYAKSLIELSNEKGVMDAVNDDMKLFSSVSNENPSFAQLLSSPIIDSNKKLKIIHQIFSSKVNELTMMFFEIVVRKGRENYLIQIAKEFNDHYKSLKKILTAEIISAAGLDDNLRKKIYDMLRNDTNSEVELIEKVDNKLIGGFVLRVGDRQYDASISSEIRKLAQAFSNNPYVKRN